MPIISGTEAEQERKIVEDAQAPQPKGRIISEDELSGQTSVAPDTSPNILSRINEDLVKRGVSISDTLSPKGEETLADTLKRAPGRALDVTGDIYGFIGDVVGEGVKSAYETLTPDKMRTAVKKALLDTLNQPENKKFVEGVSNYIDNLEKNHPESYKHVASLLNIATVGVGGKAAKAVKEAVPAGVKAAETALPKAVEAAKKGVDVAKGATMKLPSEYDKELHTGIKDRLQSLLKPRGKQQTTFKQTEKFYDNATDAVIHTVENKENIEIFDQYGNQVKGLPESLAQFDQAENSMLKHTFNEYNSMQKEATGQGAQVAVKDKLLEEIGAAYADESLLLTSEGRKFMSLLEKEENEIVEHVPDHVTPETLQNAIARSNKSLENFYKNPSYETTTRAAIEAMTVNVYRNAIEEAIDDAGYSELKRLYGAHKELGMEVHKRALQEAAKSSQLVVPFTHIYSGTTLVRALTKMNYGMVAEAATAEATMKTIKWFRNPNRLVKNMFRDAEELMEKKATSETYKDRKKIGGVIKDPYDLRGLAW